MRIVLIGAGNVATHLAENLFKSGHSIEQIYSRSLDNASLLAQKTNSCPVSDISLLNNTADLYLLSLKDDALKNIICQLPELKGIVTHTSGSHPMDILNKFDNHGVFYPFQTFSKQKAIDFKNIPILIEGNTPKTTKLLVDLAKEISDNVLEATTEQRGQLHIAAIFACNFVNHLYTLASDLLEESNLSFNLLLPLIKETALKIEKLNPRQAQTGPASRNDQQIIQKHLNILQHQPHLKQLYQLFTESILCDRNK